MGGVTANQPSRYISLSRAEARVLRPVAEVAYAIMLLMKQQKRYMIGVNGAVL